MTATETVRRTQWIIGTAAIARALAWGLATIFAALATMSFMWLAIPALPGSRTVYQAFAIVAGLIVGSIFLWRARRFTAPTQVALWVEERVPALNYSLVTGLEAPAPTFADEMSRIVAAQRIPSAALRAVRNPVSIAVGAALVALTLLYISPVREFERSAEHSGARYYDANGARASSSRFENLQARVVPPAYARERPSTLSDPSSISALSGSTITVSGRGSPKGISAAVAAELNVLPDGNGWRTSFAMPAKPAALTLRDDNNQRIIVLAPVVDAPPKIVLNAPAHDTALRAPRLVVQLAATATDDIGLASGHFEYLITTGSGEIFTARTINTATVSFDNSRTGSLTATLDLASLKLAEGDVVSMRAIVSDGNTLTGPGITSSDTRTIRIVRASEYDSLAIEAAAPPPLDSSAVSQRMLIVMTEQLVKEQPKLARPDLVKRSTDIGELEDRIRRRVRDILSDGEEAPVEQSPDSAAPTVEEMESPDELNGTKNPDLKAAYGALWEAVRSLKIAEPKAALPPMRVALKALDRARLANRLYLRGTPPRIIVDLNRVRLSGKERGNSNLRTPRSFADSVRVRLGVRFDSLVAIIDRDPARAATLIALLRVDALTALPAFASALGDASDAIRQRRDATLPLVRARRALSGPPQITPALTPWAGGGGE